MQIDGQPFMNAEERQHRDYPIGSQKILQVKVSFRVQLSGQTDTHEKTRGTAATS
jgi:hypothetical protein